MPRKHEVFIVVNYRTDGTNEGTGWYWRYLDKVAQLDIGGPYATPAQALEMAAESFKD